MIIKKNHAIAESIQDVGWREFLIKMSYKAPMYGKIFVMIDPRYTTQMCDNCGFIMGTYGTHKLTLKDRKWTCPHCGKYHIRDWNAAINILNKGKKKLGQNTIKQILGQAKIKQAA